jgi:hypothetical protein
LLALLIFGAANIHHFVAALLIGVITGTYSSIFNASQLLVLWQRLSVKEPAGRGVEARAAASKVRELKPLVEKTPKSDGGEAGEEAIGSDAKVAESKAKAAKKRKQRF